MTSVRMTVQTLTPGRRVALYAGIAVAVLALLILGSAAVLRVSGGGSGRSISRASSGGTQPAPAVSAPDELTSTLSTQQNASINDAIARLRAMPDVSPSISARYPAVPKDARMQPDVYARTFAVELFTRDYSLPRQDLLAWVQSESAQSNEPTVVGLVPPELRPKFAVFSLIDPADGGSVVVPSPRDWQAFAQRHAKSRVEILRVSQPVKWAEAVAAGQLTDPGVTARLVEAQVTTTWLDRGATRTSIENLSITLDLEASPARGGYGFVNAPTFDVVAVS